MTYAVLGTGTVGRALAGKLVSLGCETRMGSRTADNPTANLWADAAGPLASAGTFESAAAFGDVVLLAVPGDVVLSVVESIGPRLSGKVVIDVTNPLDFSRGFPPRLFVCNDDSLGEQIQRAAPDAQVVKAFNTMTSSVMVDPGRLSDRTEVFVAGDDPRAKAEVVRLLKRFGHDSPVDLGGIEASRGLEAWLLLWTRLYGTLGTGDFNVKLVGR